MGYCLAGPRHYWSRALLEDCYITRVQYIRQNVPSDCENAFICILCDTKMRLKPRYIVQLGIAFSDLFVLFGIAIVIFHFSFGPNETVCNFYVAFFLGVPYNCFFLNYFLSLIDCFVAMVFPFWHLAKLTPRRVVCGLIGLNLVMALAMKWQFISGILEVRCALQPRHGFVVNRTFFISFILCFIFCCFDFLIAWFHLPRSSRTVPLPILHPPPPSTGPAEPIQLEDLNPRRLIIVKAPLAVQEEIEWEQQEADSITIRVLNVSIDFEEITQFIDADNPADDVPDAQDQQSHRLQVAVVEVTNGDTPLKRRRAEPRSNGMAIHSSSATLSRLEWKVTRSFLCGFIPLFLIPLPLFLYYHSYHLICERLNISDRQKQLEECQDLTWLISSLFSLLICLHTLVNPITSLCFNNDLQSPSPLRRLFLSLVR